NPAQYTQMADASSSETIAPGTTITQQNWTAYKKFLPIYLQVLFAGYYPIKFGADPDYNIAVRPTEHFAYTRQFTSDTEKFNGQTRLVRVPEGGYTIAPLPQDTAGLPWAQPHRAAAWLQSAAQLVAVISAAGCRFLRLQLVVGSLS